MKWRHLSAINPHLPVCDQSMLALYSNPFESYLRFSVFDDARIRFPVAVGCSWPDVRYIQFFEQTFCDWVWNLCVPLIVKIYFKCINLAGKSASAVGKAYNSNYGLLISVESPTPTSDWCSVDIFRLSRTVFELFAVKNRSWDSCYSDWKSKNRTRRNQVWNDMLTVEEWRWREVRLIIKHLPPIIRHVYR